MKRWLLLLTLAGIGLAQNYLPPLPKDAKVNITFYSYNLASAGIGADGTKQLMEEFMAANPNIKVEGVPVPVDQLITRVQADIVAGRVPDVAQLGFGTLDYAVNNYGLRALEDIIPARELQAHLIGMHPRGIDLGRLNGKTYALAYTFSTPVLFYNADLFKAAGLDPDKPPRNWEEVRRYATAIKDRTAKSGVYTLTFGASSGDWLIQSLILSNGGQIISPDRKQLLFGQPEAATAIKTLRDLAQAGLMPNVSIFDAITLMTGGNLGMYLSTSALQGALLAGSKGKFELRAAKMPAFGNKVTRPTNSGSALYLLSRDPLKARAAWEFMKFVTSKRGYTIITSKIGYLPLRPDIVNDPQYLKSWADQNPLIKPNLEQLNNLRPSSAFPGSNYGQISMTLIQAVEAAVFGPDNDVSKVMKDAQDRAQGLMPH